jgi:hypothetical protein
MLRNEQIEEALRELNAELDKVLDIQNKLETVSESLSAAVWIEPPSHQQFRDWREALSLLIDCEEADGYITPKGYSNAVRGLEGLDDFLGKFQDAT